MAFGGEIILRARSWRRLFRFGGYATVAALSPSSYDAAARSLAVRQIYLGAWNVLPGYLAFTALLSAVIIEIVHTAADSYGLAPYALELVLRALILELIPLVTALLVALHSGAATGTEIALMRVRGELQRYEEAGVIPLREELVPRVAGAALSVFALTSLGIALTLCLAYASFYGPSVSGFFAFTRVVGQVFHMQILIGTLLKCLVFGLAVALIPLATGLEAERGEAHTAPPAVLGGLMKLFLVIGLIEILSLVVKYV